MSQPHAHVIVSYKLNVPLSSLVIDCVGDVVARMIMMVTQISKKIHPVTE